MSKSKKNKESGKMGSAKSKAVPHQVPAHPAVNEPKNHPATQVPQATQAYNGQQMSPLMMAAGDNDFDNDDY